MLLRPRARHRSVIFEPFRVFQDRVIVRTLHVYAAFIRGNYDVPVERTETVILVFFLIRVIYDLAHGRHVHTVGIQRNAVYHRLRGESVFKILRVLHTARTAADAYDLGLYDFQQNVWEVRWIRRAKSHRPLRDLP